ncbi:MAG: carboxylate-amine ligase [Spirulinaceae cyanobacterium SM2_1_0]|nr:carboxylate-amine ligase [Spirulinaceae cyanobacterium SM2_1_0]
MEEQPIADLDSRFRELQAQLRREAAGVDLSDLDDRDILVIPSFSLDQHQLEKVPGYLHYEERLLFSLIRLRSPFTRLIYVTSQPLCPSIVDYYLQLLPGIPFSHARDRLMLLSTYDLSLKPLSQKILERPRLVERIRKALRTGKSYMVCFNSSPFERELSLRLGVPLLACPPDLLYWGTKSGSREIFASAEIPHPDGSRLMWTETELLQAAAEVWERQPDLQRLVIKLNEGFSGEGNALLDLRPLASVAPGRSAVSHSERLAALRDRLPKLSFQAKNETWANFSRRLPELGAIAEAFIEGEVKRSPSCQGYIAPDGHVEILSTHDQILGGPDGQIYLGCRFPADVAYRLALQEYSLRVGEVLAAKGAIERYSVDFIAVQPPGQTAWRLEAIEINLRKGGTTHPFMALKLLTNGYYDTANGLFYSQQCQEKYYIASDNLQQPHYRGLLPSDLMDIITRHRLHFDSSTRTGTVFHLIGALSEFGKLGLTSIGNSLEEAEALFAQVEQVLDAETVAHIPHYHFNAGRSPSPPLPITWFGGE